MLAAEAAMSPWASKLKKKATEDLILPSPRGEPGQIAPRLAPPCGPNSC